MGKGTDGLFADVAGEPQYITSGLPRYGDEQLAYTWTHRLAGLHGVLFVRKKAVVWQLMVGPIPAQWRLTKAQVVRELNRYALKQKTASEVDAPQRVAPTRGERTHMRTRTTVLAIATALLVAATAIAASMAKDPYTMILRKADMPAGTQYEPTDGDDLGLGDSLAAKGIETDAASYYGMSYSKAKGSLQLSGAVYVAASPALAIKGFEIARKQRELSWKRLGGAQKIRLPATYGQQQAVLYDPAGNEGIGTVDLLVRRNSVIWWLAVKLERRPAPPKAELLRNVNTYALKQKRRVGNG